MSIRPSSAADVNRLLKELSSSDALRRETAVARLAVIGPRAVTKLSALALDAAAAVQARLAALQTLEAIADPRSINAVLALAENGDDVGVGAIGVLGSIARLKDPRAARAFDRLAVLALSGDAPEDQRLSALAALEGFPERHLKPVYEALAADRSPRVAARATRRAAGATIPLDALLESGLPDDPTVVAAVLREEADTAKLSALRGVVEAIRDRERGAGADTRAAWMAVRGQTHHALAARGSRLALYDLRETLERADCVLPVGFLAAAASIGDAACLEPLATAWVKAATADRWWREHLAEAFRAIVTREHLTRRHPALKRILERRPEAAVLVAAAKKT